jgi:hypothetical protein
MRLMRLSPHLNEKRPQPRGYTLGPSLLLRRWGDGRRKQTRSTAAGSYQRVIPELRSPLPVWAQSNGFLTAEERLDIWPVEGSSTT